MKLHNLYKSSVGLTAVEILKNIHILAMHKSNSNTELTCQHRLSLYKERSRVSSAQEHKGGAKISCIIYYSILVISLLLTDYFTATKVFFTSEMW